MDLDPSGNTEESTAHEANERHTEDTEPDREAAAELASTRVSHFRHVKVVRRKDCGEWDLSKLKQVKSGTSKKGKGRVD